MEAEPVIAIDSPDEETATFSPMVTAMVRGAAALLAERGCTMPLMRVVATADLLGAIEREGEALALPPDRRSGVERVGGVLAGKCLRSADGTRATVVVPGEAATATDGLAQLLGAGLVAHEIAHVVYDTLRDSEVGSIKDVWLPWEQAEVLALLAAAELRVGRLGYALAEVVLSPTDGDGNPVRIGSVIGPGYLGSLPDALGAFEPGLAEEIWAYRLHRLALDDLWDAVVTTSEGVLLYLAHTEAAHLGDGHAIASVEHAGVELLRPVWEPLLDHVRATPTLPEPGTWAQDRAQLRQIGLDGFTEVWRRLGLAARPEGEGFYLSVGEAS